MCAPEQSINDCTDILICHFMAFMICFISILMIVQYQAVKEQQLILESYSTQNSMRNRASQSRIIARRCFTFSTSFFIAYIPYAINVYSNIANDESAYQYPILILLHFCTPLQGFLNALIYFRPRIETYLANLKNKLSRQVVNE